MSEKVSRPEKSGRKPRSGRVGDFETDPKDLPMVAATLTAALLARATLSDKANANAVSAARQYKLILLHLTRKSDVAAEAEGVHAEG